VGHLASLHEHPHFIKISLYIYGVNTQVELLIRLNYKVKQSLHSLDRLWRFPASWGSQISRQSAHEGSDIVSLTYDYIERTK